MSTDRVHSSNSIRVLWTPMHLKDLEDRFPEEVSLKSTDDMIYRLGRRSVVKYIEMQVKKQSKNDKH